MRWFIAILLLLPTLALAVPTKHIQKAKVAKVTDGDTIVVLTAGETVPVTWDSLLEGEIIVGEFRFYNFVVNNIDPALVNVAPVGEDTLQPGLVYAVAEDALAADRCEPTTTAQFGPEIAYFVTQTGFGDPVVITGATLNAEIEADGTGSGNDFRGGFVFGSLSGTTGFGGDLRELVNRDLMNFDSFDTRQNPAKVPLLVTTPEGAPPSNFDVIRFRLEVGAIVLTQPVPPAECGVSA